MLVLVAYFQKEFLSFRRCSDRSDHSELNSYSKVFTLVKLGHDFFSVGLLGVQLLAFYQLKIYRIPFFLRAFF